MEGQRGQRFEYAETAGVGAILGFNADDGDNDLGRDAVQGRRFGQRRFVGSPETDAAVDPPIVDEARTVAFPGALQRRRRRLDQLQHLVVGSCLRELAEQFVGVEAMPLFEVAGKCHHLLIIGEAGRRGGVGASAESGKEDQGR